MGFNGDLAQQLYRGFDYVLVGDSILIVDPLTLETVAVITE
jgi:hypothetical protein